MKYILVCGNPTPDQGLEYIGPFSLPSEVLDYGEGLGLKDWWISYLKEPERNTLREISAEDDKEQTDDDEMEDQRDLWAALESQQEADKAEQRALDEYMDFEFGWED